MIRQFSACGLGALLLLPAGATAQTRSLSAATSNDIATGQRIFDAQCAWCHGAGGTGGTGPDLHRTTLGHAANDRELITLVRNGIPGTEMPSFTSALTETMARQTAAYVRSLGRARERPLPGNAQHGVALYDSNGCGGCHMRGARCTRCKSPNCRSSSASSRGH
jgi:ubiquinol-cytochrome c reductase cytochrome c subunit